MYTGLRIFYNSSHFKNFTTFTTLHILKISHFTQIDICNKWNLSFPVNLEVDFVEERKETSEYSYMHGSDSTVQDRHLIDALHTLFLFLSDIALNSLRSQGRISLPCPALAICRRA